jgi:hypothetical protein
MHASRVGHALVQRIADAGHEYPPRWHATWASPNSQVDWLEIFRRVAARRSHSGAVNRIDIGTALEEKLDHAMSAADHRSVQGRATGTIAAMHKRGIGIQKHAHTSHSTGFGGTVNREVVVCPRRGQTWSTLACFFEHRGDRVMTAIPGHVDQRVAVEIGAIGFRTRVEQTPHLVSAAVAHGYVELVQRRL